MGLFGQKRVNPVAAAPREDLLQQILDLDDKGPFQIRPGVDTDVEITNEVLAKQWLGGKKKVAYNARMLLDDAARTVFFWEMLKEVSSGLQFSAGITKTKIRGRDLFRSIREKGFGPDGKVVYDYQFDYGSLREAFKEMVEAAGWRFNSVILKGKTIR